MFIVCLLSSTFTAAPSEDPQWVDKDIGYDKLQDFTMILTQKPETINATHDTMYENT